MITIRRATFFAVMMLLMIAAPAVAGEGNTAIVGGAPGTAFYDRCQSGDPIIGLHYSSGKDLDWIEAECARLDRPGTYAIGQHGHEGSGNGANYVECPPGTGMAVEQIHVSESSVQLVHTFWITCRGLLNGQHYDSPASVTQGGAGGAALSVGCGSGSYATGLEGRADQRVNALGLMCTMFHHDASPPPPSNAPLAARKPHTVDNGG